MKGYGQFCPVAKASEIFAQRWTPLIVRELCFGPKRFSELHGGIPMMSRALLVSRLDELEAHGVVATSPLVQGKRYRLTPAGEALRPLIELMSEWGSRHGQEITVEELDPASVMFSIRRQIAPVDLPTHELVVRFEFRGLARPFANQRYWWLILRPTDAEVCQRNPDLPVDVVVAADISRFVDVWAGRTGWPAALAAGGVSVTGSQAAFAVAKQALRIADAPYERAFAFADLGLAPSGAGA
jgi:DNA-binding HxlR family transcriptional regulator